MAEEFEVKLSDGTPMKGWTWQVADPCACLCLITGMNEYAKRYERLAEWLNGKNLSVWVLDALGQGRNAASVEKQEIWPENGFEKNVEGIHLMDELARKTGVPVVQMGHSMGSFLTQRLMQSYPDSADRYILCGTNGGQGLLMKLGYKVARHQVNDSNRDLPCPKLSDMGLGGYAKAVKNARTELDWLSYNEDNVNRYIADPYCGHEDTGGFWLEFLKGMSKLWDSQAMASVSKDRPVLIIAGQEDPVGRCGKGPEWLAARYRKLGVKNVTLKLYPHMRHEIHNEKGYLEVYDDILNFAMKG
ncbi:MAG: alpha/beta hydrolase [Lachnospiraceae bacterium]|jgi:alpha-beta hydrolase superfamily lysophospholipase|nr:alpha/beta hydrolase [Lachnospiraceae bacterium]MCH4070934.1 alpha/beta hydrolase [Lachnospiraceae bacterium]MCH4107923.1 alpha/beta hydrolase [Lachnospiraceae bacterium]MCI1361629.1 alpha/beta hydrolase [Lachnospiraceae bacterium]MCI1381603.1 alpha/beta hydrolase [Lachnospiraceae bacterium]